MIKNRIARLEKYYPGVKAKAYNLSVLSTEELQELEAIVIKVEAGEKLTEPEERRAAVIMKKTEGRR